MLAKSEGIDIIKKTSTKKREIKTKPQNAESGYEKKVRMSDREYNSMRQSEGREYKKEEMKLGREDIVIQTNKVFSDTSEIIEEDSLLEELAGQNIPEVKSTVSDKSDLMQNKIKEVRTPPVIKDVEKVVYVKLKRRFDDDEENENENENDNKNKDRSYDYDNLEDLDDRMDELYGELRDDSDSINTETHKINSEIASKSIKGSSSKDPIKWKNGRLVNEKDKFFEKIRAENSDSDDDDEDDDNTVDEGEDVDESEENSENNKTERKTIIKKSNSKKVTVELTGVTMKNMLEHLETTIGFDGLFTETNLRCFSVKPSINSALKVLRQLPLEWARKKIEYLYIQSKKRQ